MKAFRVVGLAMALLLGGGSGASAKGAAPEPAIRDGAVRFAMADGRLTELDEPAHRPNLAARLDEARRAGRSPGEAVRATLRDSLVAIGAPSIAMFHDVSEPSVSTVPIGDADGDGLRDLLRVPLYSPLSLSAVRGTDGAPIWTMTPEATDGWAFPAKIGANGEDGIIVVGYDCTCAGALVASAGTVRLTVSAVRMNGTELWARSFEGSYAFAYGVVAAAYGTNEYPLFGGTFDAGGSGAVDLLVSTATEIAAYSYGPSVPVTRLTTRVIDGADGSTMSKAVDLFATSSLIALPTADVSGDGGDDYVIAYAPPSVFQSRLVVIAKRGADGSELWRTEPFEESSYFFWWNGGVLGAGDTNGNGSNDILLYANDLECYGFGCTTVHVFDGGDGRLLTSSSGSYPRAIGDVDGDGRAEIATVGLLTGDDGGDVGFRYEAFDGAGERTYETDYRLRNPTDSHWPDRIAVWPDLGDVDGDGAADAGHEMVVVDLDGEQFLKEHGAVSGRTGGKLWAARPAAPIGASIDGAGDDLVRAAVRPDRLTLDTIDGARGTPIWRATVALRSLFDYAEITSLSAADLDGDGRAEVIVDVSFTNKATVVLNGTDGSTRWTYP